MKTLWIIITITIVSTLPISATSLMDQLEIEIGKSVDAQIKEEYGVYDDAELTAYVTRLGMEMVNHSTRKKLKYTFTVLDSNDVVNAFAGPGGFVYVTTGLLRLCENNAELCGVLAHEVAHIAHHDQMDALGVNLGLMALGALATGGSPDAVAAGVAVSMNLISSGYSREDEKQADLSAVDYMVGAGMHPYGLLYFLEKLKKLHGDVSGIDVYFSSHPKTDQRIKDIKDKIWKMDTEKVDAMAWGEKGYEENVLPKLK